MGTLPLTSAGRAREDRAGPESPWLRGQGGLSVHTGHKREDVVDSHEAFETLVPRGRRARASHLSGLCCPGVQCHPDVGRLGTSCLGTSPPAHGRA